MRANVFLELKRAVVIHRCWEQSRFRFRGRELSQEYNRKSIKISMSKFVQDMEPVAVP